MRLTLIVTIALLAAPADAHLPQADQRSAAESAKAFSLDLSAPTPTGLPAPAHDTPVLPAPVPAATAAIESNAPNPAPPSPVLVAFTLDTPIGQLVADPHAKAVLDRDMPGLSDDSNLPKFQSMSLRQFQPMTGGQLSDTLLAKTGVDLAAIGSSPEPIAPSATAHPVAHKRIDSGR